MTLPAEVLDAWLLAWAWPFLRLGALFTTAPVIGTRSVPARLRLVLAAALAALLAPLLPAAPPVDAASPAAALAVAQELVIGAAIGLCLRIAFMALELAGSIMAQLMGLGFAAMIDPASGAQVPAIGQFHLVMGTLTFLTLGGHLALIELVVLSYATLPVASGGIPPELARALTEGMGEFFTLGVLIALPATAALLIVNLCFGVMTRSAPQFNVFAIGFPLVTLVGTAVLLLGTQTLARELERLFEAGFALAGLLVTGG